MSLVMIANLLGDEY